MLAKAEKEMSCSGKADFHFIIGQQEFVWNVHVAPIQDDLLLGCDFG